MSQPQTTRDLMSYHLETPGQPSNKHCVIKKNKEGELVFQIYAIPDLEIFQQLASRYTKRYIDIPHFYARLKKIIETSVKLRVFADYTNLDIKERQEEIRTSVLTDIHKAAFHIVMPDAMEKKDSVKLKHLKKCWSNGSGEFAQYHIESEKVAFLVDERANAFFAFFPERPFILKASLPSGQKMKNLLAKDPKVFSQFTHAVGQLGDYCVAHRSPYTQKKWETFLFQDSMNEAISKYQENVLNPSILELVDQTRRFLCEMILKEHGTEVAESEQKAAFMLRKNKNQIYELAEKYGYVDQAKPFLNCEDLRNQLAHPTRSRAKMMPYARAISKLYEQFVFRYIDSAFLHQYYEKFPVSFPISELGRQYDEYQVVREADFISGTISSILPTELNEKNNKKKLSFLEAKGMISSKESKGIGQLLLQRNVIAHGEVSTNGFNKPLLDILALQHELIHRQRAG